MTNHEIGIKITADGQIVSGEFRTISGEIQKFGTQAEQAGKKAKTGLKDTETGAKKAGGEVGKLKNQILALVSVTAAYQGAVRLGETTDQYTNLNARLNTVTESQDEFIRAQTETFRIAQDTFSALDSTITLYTRLDKSLGDLKGSQEIALQLTETINQSFAVSGASATEASNAIIQLAQGLGSGALRGDEFNSVMEQAPAIGEAVAKSLGLTVGELRAVAAEGAITSEVLINALLESALEIEQQYTEMPITIGKAWTTLTNEFLVYVGTADTAAGTSLTVAAGIQAIGDNLPEIISGMVTLGTVTLTYFALFKAGPAAIRILREIGQEATTAAGGMGVLQRAGLTMFAAFTGFAIGTWLRENFIEAREAGINLVNTLLQGWEYIKFGAGVAFAAIAAGWNAMINGMNLALANFLDEFADVARKIPGMLDLAVAADSYSSDLRTAANTTETLSEAIERLTIARDTEIERIKAVTNEQLNWERATEGATDTVDEADESVEAFNKRIEELQGFLEGLPDATDDGTEALKEHTEAVNLIDQAYQTALSAVDPLRAAEEGYAATLAFLNEQLSDATKDQAKVAETIKLTEQARDQELQTIQKSLRPFDQWLEGLDEELELSRLSNDERDIEQQLREANALSLEQRGIPLSAIEIQQLREKLGLLQQVNDASADQSLFGNNQNSFADLLGGAFDKAIEGGSIDNFFQAIEDGFSNLEGPEDFAEAFAEGASFLNFALGEFENNPDAPLRAAVNVAAQIPGIVGAIAQAAQNIDQLFGGRLLGTNYESVGSGVSVSLGSGGISGNQFDRQERERSFFRGTATRIVESDLDAQTINALDDFFDNLREQMAASARLLGVDLPELVAGEFVQEFDSDGNLVSSLSTVLGQVYEESIEQFQQRVLAENLLATIALSAPDIEVATTVTGPSPFGPELEIDLPGSLIQTTEIVNEVDLIARRWRDSAEELLEGAQFLLLAQVAIQEGEGLLGEATLTATTNFVEELNRTGETLSDTYLRLAGGANILEDALDLIEVSLDLTREGFVRFAADVADAAGGLEAAQSLWNAYFETFYTEQERITQRLTQALTDRDGRLETLGLESDIGVEEFRALFEQELPTLSAEAVVEWLRAAESMGIVIDLQSDLNDILDESAEAERNRIDALADVMAEIDDRFDELDSTPFQLGILRLNADMQDLINRAVELGAGEQELFRIRELALREEQLLIDQLMQDTRDLIAELYGTPLTRINEQIANSTSTQLGGINQIDQANQRRYQAELRAIQSIAGFLDDMLLDENLTNLTPAEQLAEAQRQFDEALALAQAGDTDALADLPALAQALLGEAGTFFALPSQEYGAIFDQVRDALAQFAGIELTPPTSTGNSGGGTTTQLQAERDAILAQQEDAYRLELAQMLAENLADLAAAIGQPLLDLAADLGVNMRDLVDDLGISLDTVTVETVDQLAAVAATLGIELLELADAVDVSLGSLADSQSLLNDALEARILGLPDDIQAELRPLLADVENATTEADANAAIAALEAATNALPPEFANELAPFLSGVTVTSDITLQTQLLDSLVDIQNLALTALQSLADNTLTALTPPPATPDDPGRSSAVGTEKDLSGEMLNVLTQILDELRDTNDSGSRQSQALEAGMNQLVSLQKRKQIQSAAADVARPRRVATHVDR